MLQVGVKQAFTDAGYAKQAQQVPDLENLVTIVAQLNGG